MEWRPRNFVLVGGVQGSGRAEALAAANARCAILLIARDPAAGKLPPHWL
ncbi:hypothetical protein [Croceicoccus marinus]|uniref:Uncharacterized protein n=1 Tax=Croceicoccus marinus TaxID=450378 RepID=A0A7G6VZ27_9SPHN|nr:hypothetical protein [Croceicoccus marinus]QNE06992.1 hypothetical protein H4O24_18285 [Croceicoccus marinus]